MDNLDGHQPGGWAGKTVCVSERIATDDGITRVRLCPLSGLVLSGENQLGSWGIRSEGVRSRKAGRSRGGGCSQFVIIWYIEGLCQRELSSNK